MHNEPVEARGPVTAERIKQGIERLRAQGIIIENSLQNLQLPAETKNPLAAYIVEKNNFLDELARFHSDETTQEPIAVEFLRWDDAYDRITSALRSGDAESVPDIAQAGHSWIVELANDGRVADLSGEIDADRFSPSSIISSNAFARAGLYTIPWFREMRLLYYNKSMIASPEGLATWEGFLRASREFDTSSGRRFFAFPTTITWNLLHNLAPWLWASGGDIVHAEKLGPFSVNRVTIDNPESIGALLYLKELAASGSVDFPPVSQEIVDREFRDGNYAAIISGPWITKLLGDEWRSKFGVAPVPAGPKGSFPFVGGSHLMVSEASRSRGNFERAAALVSFLTSRDAQLRFAEATGLYPANRAALEEVLNRDGDATFRNAVESGLAYPAIPNWGKVVETEFIRNNVWHIWRDISQIVPDGVLIGTVGNAAWDLRRGLAADAARRYAPTAGIAAALAAALIAFSILRSRRSCRRAIARCEALDDELRLVRAERRLLEGRALLMERHRDERMDELQGVKKKCALLQEHAARLAQELSEARSRCVDSKAKNIGLFAISADGSLILDGGNVSFENGRQARRLMQQIARQAVTGIAHVHYIWGFPLFGWEADKIRGDARRLFEVAVAKINGRLRQLNRPQILERVARGANIWKICWDAQLIAESSDIGRAALLATEAATALAEDRDDDAASNALRANDLDPANLDALRVIKRLTETNPSHPSRTRFSGAIKLGERLIGDELESLKKGLSEARATLSAGRLPRGADADDIKRELESIEHQADFMERQFESIFKRSAERLRPALVEQILAHMEAVQKEIGVLQAGGANDALVWASTVESQSFSRLISIPHISSMVHKLYNHEIQSFEDPRLVQLALISLISSPQAVDTAGAARDEGALLTHIDRGLRKQLAALEQQLGAMSLM